MPLPKPHHKRRHRKKLHLGEFQQLGVPVSARFAPGVDESGREQAMLALIQRVESMGLAYGGGDSASGMEGYVYALGGRSCDEGARAALSDALAALGFVDIEVGALSDAWYDDAGDAA